MNQCHHRSSPSHENSLQRFIYFEYGSEMSRVLSSSHLQGCKLHINRQSTRTSRNDFRLKGAWPILGCLARKQMVCNSVAATLMKCLTFLGSRGWRSCSYTGVQADKISSRNLFCWFLEAQAAPSTGTTSQRMTLSTIHWDRWLIPWTNPDAFGPKKAAEFDSPLFSGALNS